MRRIPLHSTPVNVRTSRRDALAHVAFTPSREYDVTIVRLRLNARGENLGQISDCADNCPYSISACCEPHVINNTDKRGRE